MCAAMARKSSSASEHVNIYGAHTNIARIVTITRYIHPPNHPPTRLQEEEEETPTNSAISLAPDGFSTFSRHSPRPHCKSFLLLLFPFLLHILSPQPYTAVQFFLDPLLTSSCCSSCAAAAAAAGACYFHKASSCVLLCRVSTEERRRRRILRVIGRPQAWRVWTRERHQRASKATTT